MKRVLISEIQKIGALFIPAGYFDKQPGKFVAILLLRFGLNLGDGNTTSFTRTSLGQICRKSPSSKNGAASEADRFEFDHCLTNETGSWEGSAEISSPESGAKLIQAGNWQIRKYRSSPLAVRLHDLLSIQSCNRFFPNLYFATFTPIVPSNQSISLGLEWGWVDSPEDFIRSVVLGPMLLQNFTQHVAFEIKPIDSFIITGGELPPLEEAA